MDDDVVLDERLECILKKMESALEADPYPTLPPPLTALSSSEQQQQQQANSNNKKPLPPRQGPPPSVHTTAMISPATQSLLASSTAPEFYASLQRCKAGAVRSEVQDWERRVEEMLAFAADVEASTAEIGDRLSTLLELNAEVKSQSEALSAGATSLLARKEMLERSTKSTEHKLRYFYDIDAASNTVHIPQMSPFHENFVRAIQKLDEAERFLTSHRHYQSAPTYLTRVYTAKQKALTIVRDVVTARIGLATTHVTASPNFKKAMAFDAEASDDHTPLDISVEAAMVGNVGILTVLNVEYRSKLTEVLPLVAMLQDRCKGSGVSSASSSGASSSTSAASAASRDIRTILDNVVAHYVSCRTRVLRPLLAEFVRYLQRNLSSFLDPPQLKHLASGGVSYLLALVVEEQVLLDAIWNPNKSAPIANMTKLYLTSILDNVSCELFDAYRSEILREDDIKTLCFLVDCLTNSLLEGKVKSAGGDVGKFVAPVIKRMVEDTQERLYFRSHMFIKDVLSPFTFTSKDLAVYLCGTGPMGGAEPFPPLENCLFLLSMLYNSISKDVFCGIAEEAMRIAVAATERAVKIMRTTGVVPPSSSSVDGDTDDAFHKNLHHSLFALRIYLRLREQITPFSVNFSVSERGLDLATLVRTRNMTIMTTSRDAKKLLEDEIRSVCELFIDDVSRALAGPIKSFCTRLTQATSPSAEQYLSEIRDDIVPGLMARAARVRENYVKPYIGSGMTASVLWKPITTNVVDEYRKVHALLVDTFSSEATVDTPTPQHVMIGVTGLSVTNSQSSLAPLENSTSSDVVNKVIDEDDANGVKTEQGKETVAVVVGEKEPAAEQKL
eukprot:PhM_4_TR13294/c0_g1_i1/m.92154/K20290/COG3, SEC34; conserved oligomeric Golgi complex subunit 3